ncbi:prostaglandin D2 receptor isoform X1 [Equus przewalskii]|uniref:Prostaglandin D2 receptor isoform X1 n=1 Tax=Equus przewalskii TaxID=9798 RepID=A0ABM2FKN5_EQUPR|nr:PREDICTED: prostaglandin D2 receptor isoform X1 [Equus przewalskii]XP_014589669.2 prostaglandin D2 receptor isoform X1 [Equus caballus]
MRPLLYRCHNTTAVEKGNSATMSGVLFSAGLLGNLLALGLLARSGLGSCPPRPPPSVFYVLVSGLTVTDLLGKSLVSPFVLAAYAQNRSLWGLAPASGSSLCQAFAFFMSFFGLASTLQLLAMALECWLSLGHPFFYRRHITLRRGALVAPAVGAFCLAFCALPFAGFGSFVQYCPGTWCFIQMAHEERSLSVLGYSALYAGLMALLVLAIVLCNLSAMRNLYTMHRRLQQRPRPCARDRTEPGAGAREAAPQPLEELDHLLLLALMTALFTVCSLPLIGPGNSSLQPHGRWDSHQDRDGLPGVPHPTGYQYRAYRGAFRPVLEENGTTGEAEDLRALRFLSVISIADPWIFIIFRTAVFRMFFHKIFIRPLMYRNWHSNSCQTNTESSL